MIYYVTLYDAGVWNGEQPYRIDGNSPMEAAEKVAGQTLVDSGPLGRLRATVRDTTEAAPILSAYVP